MKIILAAGENSPCMLPVTVYNGTQVRRNTNRSSEMNLFQHKTENVIVDLLPETATNKYGKKLFWIRLENGNTVSIWEGKFNNDFQPA